MIYVAYYENLGKDLVDLPWAMKYETHTCKIHEIIINIGVWIFVIIYFKYLCKRQSAKYINRF